MPSQFIRGKLNVACNQFIDHLETLGIHAAVGHAGSAKKGLFVRIRSRTDSHKVPKEFHGLPVHVEFEPLETDPLKTPSQLVLDVAGLLESRKFPDNGIAAIKAIIESWENNPAEFTSAHDGFLMIGIDPETSNVVIDLGKDRIGHLNFTSEQARTLAKNLVRKADELDTICTH